MPRGVQHGMIESRLNELVHRLRSHGGRMTPQRMAILKTLLTEDHPTVQQIYAIVSRDFPMTSLVTVYRTIALLRDSGEVLEVDSYDPTPHYDGLRPSYHPHLVCEACGRVVDSPDLELRTLTEDIARRAGNWALSQEVHFFGLCPACRAHRNPQRENGGGDSKQRADAPGYVRKPSARAGSAG